MVLKTKEAFFTLKYLIKVKTLSAKRTCLSLKRERLQCQKKTWKINMNKLDYRL